MKVTHREIEELIYFPLVSEGRLVNLERSIVSVIALSSYVSLKCTIRFSPARSPSIS